MKAVWLIISFLFYSLTMFSQKTEAVNGVSMVFDNEHIALGKVIRGDKVEFDFTFTNLGSENIEIEIVSGCECTTLDWPRKKINPGEIGVIDVIFDSTEKEESEVVDVDITLKNIDPKTGDQMFKILTYSFELILE